MGYTTPTNDTTFMGSLINNSVHKTTIIDADKIGFWDSVTGLFKYSTWAEWKTVLASVFAPLSAATTVVTMTADQPNSGTTTNQTAITELITPIVANSKYRVKILFNTDTVGTGGVRFGLLFPADAIFYGEYSGRTTAAATHSHNPYMVGTAQVGGLVNSITTSKTIVKFEGILYTGATAGNFQPLFASGTSPQVSTIYYQGTIMEIVKI